MFLRMDSFFLRRYRGLQGVTRSNPIAAPAAGYGLFSNAATAANTALSA